ncbi:LOW QUALITY PROTEIN: serine/arginine-rich splicing factor 2-like [Diretmus argenteus]
MNYGRPPPDMEGMTSLKVDNLTYGMSPETLRRVFKKYGRIGDMYMPWDRYTKKSRGFAFVGFHDKRDAEDAMAAMHGAKLHGRYLHVQMVGCSPPDSHYGRRGGGPHRRYGGYGRRSRSRSGSHRRRRRSGSRRRSRCRSRSRYSRSRSRYYSSRSRYYSRSKFKSRTRRSKSIGSSRSRSRSNPGFRAHQSPLYKSQQPHAKHQPSPAWWVKLVPVV